LKTGADSVDQQVKDKRWPANGLLDPVKGLIELQDIVELEAVKWRVWRDANISSQSLYLSAHDCTDFVGCLLAAIYVFGCQGRVMAFDKMKMRDVDHYLETGDSPMSDAFKTVLTYGKQVNDDMYYIHITSFKFI
jgi:hypothetical protein